MPSSVGEDSGSEVSYYSASDGEGVGSRRADEVEEEMWRNEWRGEFVAVGSEFFDGAEKVDKGERGVDDGGSRVQRRLKRMERERRERRQQRKERHERRQKRLAAVEVMSGEESNGPIRASTQPTSQAEDGSMTTTTAVAVEGKEEDYEDEVQQVQGEGDADDAMQIDDVINSSQGFMMDLWLLIEKPTRSVLKRLTDYAFIHDVEQVLFLFKSHVQELQQQLHQRSRAVRAPAPFSLASSPSSHYRVLPAMVAGELILHMPEPFLRLLTYGVLSFHLMYPVRTGRGGREQSNEDGIIIVRVQRGCPVYHHCSLATYCSTHFSQ